MAHFDTTLVIEKIQELIVDIFLQVVCHLSVN